MIKKLNKNYDAIVWSHGPEHITWDQFKSIHKDIQDKANHIVIYQAPIGFYPQGAEYNNPYEVHVATLYGHMFEELGYKSQNHLSDIVPSFTAWIVK